MHTINVFLTVVILAACTNKKNASDSGNNNPSPGSSERSPVVEMNAEWYYSFGYNSPPELDCVAFYANETVSNVEPCEGCDVIGFVAYESEEGVCNDGSAQVSVPEMEGFALDSTNFLVYKYDNEHSDWDEFGNFPNLMSCVFSLADTAEPTATGSEASCRITTASNTGHTFEFEWRLFW